MPTETPEQSIPSMLDSAADVLGDLSQDVDVAEQVAVVYLRFRTLLPGGHSPGSRSATA